MTLINDFDSGGDGGPDDTRFLIRYKRLVDESPAILWAFDEVNGRMVFVNHVVETVLGYPVERFYERAAFWFELIHGDDRAAASALNLAMREEKKPINYVLRFRRGDGSYVKLAVAVKPIFDNRNHIVRTEGAAVVAAGESP